MASSKKWATTISSIASFIYFLVIILQIPLFSIPCTGGICRTPVEVTSSQLIASEVFPLFLVKALLYPGAFANAFIKNKAIPGYDNLKLYNFTNVKAADAISDLQRLEVLVGSYLSVAGAFLGLIRPGRMSLFGMLLIVWGLVREIFSSKSTSTDLIYMYPAILFALFAAFLSITRDVRRIIRCCRAPRFVKTKLI
ncbi:hypothetical protein FF1_025096 [Malus domestica]|uniref:uncharacterized protein LOC126610225 n=1 Tax=Malus sylvestris TaxID=3752 RepID=UPI0021ABB6A5|nr:uncharacterized protein LOC126610225 [Malus sylvestris]